MVTLAAELKGKPQAAIFNKLISSFIQLGFADRGALLQITSASRDFQVKAVYPPGENSAFLDEATLWPLIEKTISTQEACQTILMEESHSSLLLPFDTPDFNNIVYLEKGVEKGRFEAVDIDLIQLLLQQAAVVLENGRLKQSFETYKNEKTQYISLVAHELRLPMTSIKGYADLMKNGMSGPLNEMQTQFIEVISRNLNKMNVLVTDLAEINRFESDRVRLDKKVVALNQLINEVVSQTQEALSEKGQKVIIDTEKENLVIFADENRVTHLLTILLRNAHLYSPEDSIINIKAFESSPGEIAVSIKDKGCGIAETEIDKIFMPFYRSDRAEVRAQTGWGLGLPIAKYIVDAHQGQLEIETVLGSGSTFSFKLPQS